MSIRFDPEHQTLTLDTRRTTYQMQIHAGRLEHLYYGRRAEGPMDALFLPMDFAFSPTPYEFKTTRNWSLDVVPQEYSGANTGDFRLSSIDLRTDTGVWGADLRYVRHEIRPGKYDLTGLPCAFARDGEAETLSVLLSDEAAGIEVELLYGVFEERDTICRAARIRNAGTGKVWLEKAASVCLDVPFGAWDLVHFQGRHAMERQMERVPLMHGIHTVSSRRGVSSHQHNPFVILCGRDTDEDQGDCYGVMLSYSGSFRIDAEVDQLGSVRLISAIHDQRFTWELAPGETFDTPETILSFSHEGLGELSRTYHRFLRRHVIRSGALDRPRPVLLNNWEGTYFDFDTEKLLSIARHAKDLGVDLLVLDDGWFGKRDDDNSGLGDWYVNERKLPGGLGPLISQVNALGLKFGLWIEPEMVSEDSDLYRAHPDWALTVPGRRPAMGRNQLVLDMGRKEVVDHLFDAFSELLRREHIEYIKWDMNRNLTDLYSRALPEDRQGEAPHRYVLGLYDLARRLTEAFPDVLFEGCSGGGGRFDAGMLAYFPQIWCSDDTDAIERLEIQRGTSFGYPPASMGAHVSASPNHQTGRDTPLGTRAVVAMAGTFGYELDPGKLTEEEKEEVKGQIARFRRYDALLRDGDLYRLSPSSEMPFTAWQVVAPDRSEALLSVVLTHPRANPTPLHLCLRGLDPDARYVLRRETFGARRAADQWYLADPEEKEDMRSGSALMYGGLTLPSMFGDFPSVQVHLKKV